MAGGEDWRSERHVTSPSELKWLAVKQLTSVSLTMGTRALGSAVTLSMPAFSRYSERRSTTSDLSHSVPSGHVGITRQKSTSLLRIAKLEMHEPNGCSLACGHSVFTRLDMPIIHSSSRFTCFPISTIEELVVVKHSRAATFTARHRRNSREPERGRKS